jgi:hypothetical protein
VFTSGEHAFGAGGPPFEPAKVSIFAHRAFALMNRFRFMAKLNRE